MALTWPYPQPPLPGELLSSCLARNAAAHGTTPYRLMALSWPRDPVWERDFDRDPAGLLRLDRTESALDWLGDIAGHLGVRRDTVEDATLAGWREQLDGGLTAEGGETPLILSAGVFHRTRTRYALQFCPACLLEGPPHFRKAWRLGFAVACAEHASPLLDACRCCGAAVVPHRSMTPRLTDCHQCGLSVAGHERGTAKPVPEAALTLQRHLAAVLSGDADTMSGPLGTAGAFATVRTLLAVSAPLRVHKQLRSALGLEPVMATPGGRRRFEQAQLAERTPWLETVATWVADWPRNFLAGADAINASQRTFARSRMGPALAQQVKKLPERNRKARQAWKALLDEPELRRMRRQDSAAYHATRAKRVLHAIGRD